MVTIGLATLTVEVREVPTRRSDSMMSEKGTMALSSITYVASLMSGIVGLLIFSGRLSLVNVLYGKSYYGRVKV